MSAVSFLHVVMRVRRKAPAALAGVLTAVLSAVTVAVLLAGPSAAPAAAAVPKVMVVGDSISQGLEGDYTWRYRLSRHFADNGVAVDFVGPWSGTTMLPAAVPAGYPDVSVPPNHTGAYRPGITFTESQNYAQWGWQLHQAKDVVNGTVSTYQPDYLVVELGFNDLGWSVSSPSGLADDLRTFVANARAAKPNLKIIVGNVVHRTPLDVAPDLPQKITEYDASLGSVVSSLSTATSPVVMADLDTPYDENQHTYDGLHPNGVGEYVLAKAFATVFQTRFGLGPAFGTIPATVAGLQPGAPASITATATDAGITVSWPHVFGAGAYILWSRDVTAGGTLSRALFEIPADSWRVNQVFDGHVYEFAVETIRGSSWTSARSATASVTAHPRTAAGPTATTVAPAAGTTYVDLAWTAPTGAYSDTVSSYVVLWRDVTADDPVVSSARTSARSYRLTGLNSGHRYDVALASVNAAGEGMPSGAPTFRVGYGTPARATLDHVVQWDAHTVLIRWVSQADAAGYYVWNKPVGSGTDYTRLPFTILDPYYFQGLIDAPTAYVYCVQSMNGTLRTLPSECHTPPYDRPGAAAASAAKLAAASAAPSTAPAASLLELLKERQP